MSSNPGLYVLLNESNQVKSIYFRKNEVLKVVQLRSDAKDALPGQPLAANDV